MPIVHASLVVFSDEYRCTPLGSGIAPTLIINRSTNEVSLEVHGQRSANAPLQELEIFGIYGIVPLLLGNYLVVITGRERACTFFGSEVWKIGHLVFLPFFDESSFSPAERRENAALLSHVESYLASIPLFYSESVDLTRSAQSLDKFRNAACNDATQPLCERVDRRFFFNSFVCEVLARVQAVEWILPVIAGFFQNQKLNMNGVALSFYVISRLSPRRLGTRLTRRGVDSNGNAANFVETEQLMLVGDRVFSYVQCRGSAPVVWSQPPNLEPRPPIIFDFAADKGGCERHFAALWKEYGHVMALNLLSASHWEGKLEQAYAENVDRLKTSKENSLRYVWYEVNRLIGKSSANIGSLFDLIHDDVERFGYFLQQGPKVFISQRGVVRTNCLDSLDRTNFVQSLIGEHVLVLQLRSEAILGVNDTIDNHPLLAATIRKLWADNGDACSMMYTGTPALRRSFLEQRKLTLFQMLKDGFVGASRWYMCCFSLAQTQDAIDALSGNLILQGYSSDIKKKRRQNSFFTQATWLLFFIALSMFIGSVTGYTAEGGGRFIYSFIWFVLFTACARFAIINSREFVALPLLEE